ncbi:ClpP/crotonase-like domain-containing protein [Baffinella frigidus]|nr:ClpP/crotonase-like domain-containing protein [Cryptophyta sp. CCMP2293]|mmetsp:Transcript_36462/g.82842  ORF Transcript_36462/g.82842 Transcript_36462/m.82842 type:complete len:327 (-) Transcript_36462:159-1139(-)
MLRIRGVRALHAATKFLPQAARKPTPPSPPPAFQLQRELSRAAVPQSNCLSGPGKDQQRGMSGSAGGGLVSVEVGDSGVATIFLNSMTMPPAFFSAIKDAMDSIQADSRVRCVVLRAGTANKHFSYGLDLKEAAKGFAGIPMDGPRHELRKLIAEWQGGFTAVAKSPKPVVAAISGWCIGAGVELISAADIRVCSKDAKFSLKEAELGIVADLGGLQRLPPIIGAGATRHLALTAATISASEAYSLSLVTAVHDDAAATYAAAEAIAVRIASFDPHAMAGIKSVLEFQENKTADEGLAFVASHNAGLLDVTQIVAALKAIESKIKK